MELQKGPPMRQPNALFPLNQDEMSRLNAQHRLFRQATGRNYFAPLRNPHRILDVGYGTGIWCMEVARQFHQATIIGFDENPSPYKRAKRAQILPPNLQFIQGSLLRRLPFESGSFDYVHARFIACEVPVAHWPALVSELARVTRPGGCIELTGAEFPPASTGPIHLEFMQATQALFAHFRVTLIGAALPGWLEEAGLTDLHSRRLMLRGKGLTKNFAQAAQNLYPTLVQYGLFSSARFDGVHGSLYQEMLDGQVQLPVVVAWATKPLVEKSESL
jgi:ubiquinone/menaquinone biosynthesis C-methylase UbiE